MGIVQAISPPFLSPDSVSEERPPEQPTGRAPQIRMRAFCETAEVASALTLAMADRRLSRVEATVVRGGIAAATQMFRAAPTPELLVLESHADRRDILAGLAALADVCDGETKVVVIGSSNDISLYRDLMDRGIADYLVAPVDPLTLIGSVLRLFRRDAAGKAGKVCAFIGAKGGVGSSTLAQNVAWSLAETLTAGVMLADLDLHFGTAALNFNVEPGAGLAEHLKDATRLDEALFERLLIRRGKYLSLLPGTGADTTGSAPAPAVFDKVIDLAQAAYPFVVLDVPHVWSPWVRHTLTSADEIIITAVPDLANLRNAKCLIDLLKQARPNDAPPRLVLNQIGMPKRAEIKATEFAAALQIDLLAQIGFEPMQFSTAANKGEMMGEAFPRDVAGRAFDLMAQTLSGRASPKRKTFGGLRFWKR